jgi:flagellar secretion chaperone FliS
MMMSQTTNAAQLQRYKKQASQYQEQQVQTASKEQLLIMLYDGAIRFCKLAKKAMSEGKLEESNKNLLRSQRIISEFMASLDFEIGGETSKNLFSLYEYLHYRLVQANIKRDPEMIDEVTEHLVGLRDTWNQAIEIARREEQLQGTKHHV